ncbi:hypothetical protein AN403_5856 [Pseudomonas fluorescens]|uniref:Uncharacterized protein n=1 Tax=Pseudomonas fluorescens TaxID=294 RepID=A0A0P8Z8E8_PSEFL|nr:hypothetical protein AN403_5856 [Pseudomonas fluorescens]
MCDMLSQSQCRRAFEEAGLVHGNVTKPGCFAGFRFFRFRAQSGSFNTAWRIARAPVISGLRQGQGQ